MHLSWKDYETLVSASSGTWRDYVRFPHLLVCTQCRRELKEHRASSALLRDLKAAYMRGEEVHQVMATKGGSQRR